MNQELIAFRAAVEPKQIYTINGPIYFPDGTKGLIRSITDVRMQRDGRVYVIGKYRDVTVRKDDTI